MQTSVRSNSSTDTNSMVEVAEDDGLVGGGLVGDGLVGDGLVGDGLVGIGLAGIGLVVIATVALAVVSNFNALPSSSLSNT